MELVARMSLIGGQTRQKGKDSRGIARIASMLSPQSRSWPNSRSRSSSARLAQSSTASLSSSAASSSTSQMEKEEASRLSHVRDLEEWEQCSSKPQIARMVKSKNCSEHQRLRLTHTLLDKQLHTSLRTLEIEQALLRNSMHELHKVKSTPRDRLIKRRPSTHHFDKPREKASFNPSSSFLRLVAPRSANPAIKITEATEADIQLPVTFNR